MKNNKNLQQISDISWSEHHKGDENDGIHADNAIVYDEFEVISKSLASFVEEW